MADGKYIAMLKFLLTNHFKRYGWWIIGRHVVFRCTNELVTHITANDNHNRASKITDYPQGLVYESLKRRLFFRIFRPDLIHSDFLKCQKKKSCTKVFPGNTQKLVLFTLNRRMATMQISPIVVSPI